MEVMDNEPAVDNKAESGSQSSQNLFIFSQERFNNIVSQETRDLIAQLGFSESNSEAEVAPVPVIWPETVSRFSANVPLSLEGNGGRYNFQLSFGREERISKSCSWTFSKTLQKLYVSMDTACPFRLSASPDLPSGSYIRATLYYKKCEDLMTIPVRCLLHRSDRDPSNIGAVAPDHLIRSDLALARYERDWETERTSVLVPYQLPEDGMKFTTYIFKLMCLTSCSGGMDRRPAKIVFTLENQDHLCLGRRSIEIRVCACPGRDRLIDEKRLEKQATAAHESVVPPLVANLKRSMEHYRNGEPLPKQSKNTDDTRHDFVLQTKNKRVYKTLLELKAILELEPLFP